MASKPKLVLVSDLKPSPANRELYDDFDANDPKMQKLVEQMKLHYQQTKKNGNYEVIVIDKNNYIRSGDRRTFASKLAGIKYILAIVCDDDMAYDPKKNSRLSCQIIVSNEFDGVEGTTPEKQA